MKKILVVAYFFPPFGGVGAFRIRKLVKYFNRFGWNITVLTVDEKYYETNSIDKNTYEDISKNVRVIRTKRIKQFTKFKEQGLYWFPQLFAEQFKILKNEEFDYVYYTGGPFIHFILAPIMKRIFSQKYILDFRDPWLLTPYNDSKLRKCIAKILEPICVKDADYILNVTNDATEMYKSYYNNVDKKKFITIENGYDSEDFEKIKEDTRLDDNTIVYAGKLGNFRNIKPFLEVIKKYNEISEEKIKFVHIGAEENSINEFIKNNKNSENYIISLGFQPYIKTLEYIKRAKYALIISGGHPYEPTTKVYDYMALNKNILCINDIEYGYLHEIMSQYSKAIISKNNIKDIEKSFNLLVSYNKLNNNIKINSDKFDRKIIFKNLNDIIS